jgi:hypothetical protein
MLPTTKDKCYKTVYVRNLRITGKPVQPNLMFMRKAGGYPSGAPKRSSSEAGKACKYKHSSSLRKLVNYGRKFFIKLGPGGRRNKRFTAIELQQLANKLALKFAHCMETCTHWPQQLISLQP